MLNGFRARGESELAARRERDIASHLDTTKKLLILDVANGRLRPQYTILKAAGHHVFGIDWINRKRLSRVDVAYAIARRIYMWKLGIRKQPSSEQTLACGDVGSLPYPDGRFDLAVSAAAFEHFLDVPAVVAELHRVLRPGGLVWISIHLFTSPSGGHNVSFTEFPLRTLPAGADPWDHLRRRQIPFRVPLNEWRKDQYAEAFSRHFEILNQYCATREGEAWLTPELEAELSGYTSEELTCSTYVIVARKAA